MEMRTSKASSRSPIRLARTSPQRPSAPRLAASAARKRAQLPQAPQELGSPSKCRAVGPRLAGQSPAVATVLWTVEAV